MGEILTLKKFLKSRFVDEVEKTKEYAEELKKEFEKIRKKTLSIELPYAVISVLLELSGEKDCRNISKAGGREEYLEVIEKMGFDPKGGEKTVDIIKVRTGIRLPSKPTYNCTRAELIGAIKSEFSEKDNLAEVPYKKVFDVLEKYRNEEYGYFISRIMECLSWNEWKGKERMRTIIDKDLENLINNGSKQIIFTGAPGTGKTFSVKKYVKAEVGSDESRYKFIQFHPSYDYSDFVEGLRPACIGESSTPTFVRLDGTFKAFCRKVVEENLKFACQEYANSSPNEKKDTLNKICEYYKNQDNKKDNECKYKANPQKYFFIVDEINRADLSKVFGELMFGLEESYRGIENRFDTQYKNLKTYEIDENGKGKVLEFDCFEAGFFIPHNLYIIGTMNDIDRSVESFDFALRRRFQWVDIKANEVMDGALISMLNEDGNDEVTNEIKKVSEQIKEMNMVISSDQFAKFGLSEAYHIGPAYFKDLKLEDINNSKQKIFDHKIASILREYTRGRKEQDVRELLKACAAKLGVKYE